MVIILCLVHRHIMYACRMTFKSTQKRIYILMMTVPVELVSTEIGYQIVVRRSASSQMMYIYLKCVLFIGF